MGWVLAVFAVILFVVLGVCLTYQYMGDDMCFLIIISFLTAALCFVGAISFFQKDDSPTGSAIDLDNCRYVGAEVYATDDDHTVFIDITSGDGALYAYNGQVDSTAQYMLTLDAKTGEILAVWQNVN